MTIIMHIDLLRWLKEFNKRKFQKLVFQEISKEFIKNKFELMISIDLFTKVFQFDFVYKWIDFFTNFIYKIIFNPKSQKRFSFYFH